MSPAAPVSSSAPARPTSRRARLVCAAALCAVLLTTLGGCGNGEGQGLVIAPKVVDFGSMMQGPTFSRTFTLHNATDRDILIDKPRSACPCIALKRPYTKRILRGERAEYTILLTSGAAPAEPLVNKTLELDTDHPDHKVLRIPVRGTIEAPFQVSATQLVLGHIEKPFEARTIRVRPHPGYQLRAIKKDGKAQVRFATAVGLQVEYVEQKLGYDLVVRLDPAGSRLIPGQQLVTQLQAPTEIRRGETVLKHNLVLPVRGTWNVKE